jgi:DNA-binding IclR family transcriptional regulator
MIQSVERAFKILEMLNSLDVGSKGLGGLEISRRLNIKHPTIHNFLKTLNELGYVEQNPETSKFHLGEKALHLGLNLLNADALLHIAKPLLKNLAKEIDETVVLVIYDKGKRHAILVEESQKPIRISINTTVDDHFYTTATGRILLANMTDVERRDLQSEVPMLQTMRYCPKDETELNQTLEQIKNKGFEIIKKDILTVIGVPLINKSTGLNASLGTYYPPNGHDTKSEAKMIDAMRKTAQTIQTMLNKNC